MDRTDFGLIQHLFRRPFASFEELGRASGLSGSAAKARIQELTRTFVIPRFWAVPAAEIFERHARVYIFDNPRRPSEAVAKALRDDSVVWVKAYQDVAIERRLPGSLAVLCYHRGGDDMPSSLISEFGKPTLVRTPGPPMSVTDPPVLSPLDWRILSAMMRDPRASPSALSSSSGLSEKTVRVRRDRLVSQGIVGVQPAVNGARARRGACFHLVVYGTRGVDLPDVSRISDGVLVETMTEPIGLIGLCWADSVADVISLDSQVADIPGVRLALLALQVTCGVAEGRLEEWIRAELVRWRRPT